MGTADPGSIAALLPEAVGVIQLEREDEGFQAAYSQSAAPCVEDQGSWLCGQERGMGMDPIDESIDAGIFITQRVL